MYAQHHRRVSHFHEATTIRDEEDSPQSSLKAVDFERETKYNYKPPILRTAGLLLLLAFTGALIGLLEYAARELPHGNGRGGLSPRGLTDKAMPRLFARATNTFSSSSTASVTTSDVSSKVASSDYLRTDKTTTVSVTASVASSDYMQTAKTTTATTVHDAEPSTDFLGTRETSTITRTIAPAVSKSLYLNTVNTATVTPSPASTNEGDYLPTAHTTSIYASAASGDYLPTEATEGNSSAEQSDYVPTTATLYVPTSDYVPTIYPSAAPTDYVPTQQTSTTAPETTTIVIVTTSSRAIVQTIPSPNHNAGSTATVGSGDYLLTTGSDGVTESAMTTAYVPTLTTSYELVPLTLTMTSIVPANTANPLQQDPNASNQGQNTSIKVSVSWNDTQVFMGTFLAVLLAVLYRIVLSMAHTSLVLIDPFRGMMEPQGAVAENAFFSFYHNASILLGPIPALRKGRWAVAFTASAYLAACAIPALASEVIWVDTDYSDCPLLYPVNPMNPCQPRLTASATVVRVLEGLLGFTGLVILGLGVLLFCHKTGLPADPSSMATVSTLMRHPGLSEDLNEIPVGPAMSLYSMKQALAGRKYGMGYWKTSGGAQGYGIYPQGLDTDVTRRDRSVFGTDRGSYSAVNADSSWDETSTKTHTWLWMDPILLFLAIGTFGVVLAWRFTSGTHGFNAFFGSDTFGPRFILTLAATIIANMWGTVEQSAILMAPFIRLSKQPSSAHGTICFSPTSTPLLSTWRTVRHGYFFAAVVTVVTLLVEALSIVISGVPYSRGQTYKTWLISEYMSLAILGIMIIASVLVIWHRRQEPKISVLPETLGAKMIYLNGSRMADSVFDGLSIEKSRVRDKRLRALGKEYEFRPMIRADGKRTWLVDEATERNGQVYEGI